MDDETWSEGATRRTALKFGGTLLGAGLLAGCTGGGDSGGTAEPTSDTETETATETPTATATETESPTATETETETTTASEDPETPYSVSMAPVGEVTFESVPETWVANNGSWADMGIALGLEPPEAVWLSNRYHTQYYDAVEGVSVDGSSVDSLYSSGGVSKEAFYDYDADVHVMDPNFLQNRFKGWEKKDVQEIANEVGPMFGNCIYAQHYPWHEDYRYYSLYEGFEKLAKVFKRTDRYEAFEKIHDDFQSNLAPHVPGPADRPEVAVLWGVGNLPC